MTGKNHFIFLLAYYSISYYLLYLIVCFSFNRYSLAICYMIHIDS